MHAFLFFDIVLIARLKKDVVPAGEVKSDG